MFDLDSIRGIYLPFQGTRYSSRPLNVYRSCVFFAAAVRDRQWGRLDSRRRLHRDNHLDIQVVDHPLGHLRRQLRRPGAVAPLADDSQQPLQHNTVNIVHIG